MTWRAERSGPKRGSPSSLRIMVPSSLNWGTPALRKYLDTMMSAATWDHEAGISASVISNTIEPSGLVIRESRRDHSTVSYGSTPSVVKRLSMLSLVVIHFLLLTLCHPFGVEYPQTCPQIPHVVRVASPYPLHLAWLHECNYIPVIRQILFESDRESAASGEAVTFLAAVSDTLPPQQEPTFRDAPNISRS